MQVYGSERLQFYADNCASPTVGFQVFFEKRSASLAFSAFNTAHFFFQQDIGIEIEELSQVLLASSGIGSQCAERKMSIERVHHLSHPVTWAGCIIAETEMVFPIAVAAAASVKSFCGQGFGEYQGLWLVDRAVAGIAI